MLLLLTLNAVIAAESSLVGLKNISKFSFMLLKLFILTETFLTEDL